MTASAGRQTTGCWLYDIEWLYTAWVLALFDTYRLLLTNRRWVRIWWV